MSGAVTDTNKPASRIYSYLHIPREWRPFKSSMGYNTLLRTILSKESIMMPIMWNMRRQPIRLNTICSQA